MTPEIHDLLHKLAKLNKVRERNSRKFSKVLTRLIICIEKISNGGEIQINENNEINNKVV